LQEVRVVRSAKRTRTVSANIVDGVLIVSIPARLSKAEELEWIERMRKHFEKKRRRQKQKSDGYLATRARILNLMYFGGKLEYQINWVENQQRRWGSCTPGHETIRISRELEPFPEWVLDYVVMHELAHLVEPNHSAAFWKLVYQYPQTDKAIGFLMGFSTAKDRATPSAS
jgi:predicted metal-dependent hydrolase